MCVWECVRVLFVWVAGGPEEEAAIVAPTRFGWRFLDSSSSTGYRPKDWCSGSPNGKEQKPCKTQAGQGPMHWWHGFRNLELRWLISALTGANPLSFAKILPHANSL